MLKSTELVWILDFKQILLLLLLNELKIHFLKRWFSCSNHLSAHFYTFHTLNFFFPICSDAVIYAAEKTILFDVVALFSQSDTICQ